MKIALAVLGVVVLLALILGGNLMSSRNELVTEKNSVEGAWAQVDVALQRRADLILGEGLAVAADHSGCREDWGVRRMVEARGIEPLTSSLRTRRSPS